MRLEWTWIVLTTLLDLVIGANECGISDTAGPLVVESYQDGKPWSIGSYGRVVSHVHSVRAVFLSVTLYIHNSTTNKDDNVAYIAFDGNPSASTPVPQELASNPEILTYSTMVENYTLTISWDFSYLPKDYNGVLLTTQAQDYPVQTYCVSNQTKLEVQACPSSMSTSAMGQESVVITILSLSNGHYGESAKCSCPIESQKLVFMNGTEADGVATCGLQAKWLGCEMLQCWSSPANITVSQEDNMVKSQYPFACFFSTGFPNNTRKELRIDNTIIDDSYSLKSSDNNRKVWCNVSSDYTVAFPGMYGSAPLKIQVFYPPENSTLSDKSPVIEVNESMVLNYSVYANPEDSVVNMTVEKSVADYPALFSWRQNFSEGDHHIHELNINVLSEQNYGSYKVCSRTSRPSGKDCVVFTICNNMTAATSAPPDSATYSVTTDAKEPMRSGISTLTIVLVVIALVILLVLIVVSIFLCRRRKSKNKEGKKEERINELYGSVSGQGVSENPGKIKQEKDNVLYVSTPGEASTNVEEYAMANPECIPNADIVQYVTSNPDTGQDDVVVLSASTMEACSSSNMPIYAQVDKRKGNINDGFHEENADSEPAVAYAAIDKSNKRDAAAEIYTVVNKSKAKD